VPAVALVDYDDTWPAQFGRVERELADALAGCSPRLEHVGSTSVPGLCAKPVLDVLLGVSGLEQVERRSHVLRSLGYRYRPEHEAQVPQRRYFVRDASALPRVHLHAVVTDGPLWLEHLAFRDALRRDAALAARYAGLKRELAVTYAGDKAGYTAAKAPFIRQVLAFAISARELNTTRRS
jgi:GrpB-like predicted nucleotidyltransferase (UPF0157 family)